MLTYSSISNKKLVKTLNIIFSQINNVNSTIIELHKLHIVRKYLIKSYQGYCHALGKPVRGQRTWSNAWNSFKCNNVLRNFISKVKHLKSFLDKNTKTKIDYRSVKKRYKAESTVRKNSPKKTKNTFLVGKSWY